jgi:hypothetical protein
MAVRLGVESVFGFVWNRCSAWRGARRKEGSNIRLSIPMHEGRDLKVGLLKHLMKLAGVEESDL